MATTDRIRLTDALASVATLPEGKTDVVLWDSEVIGFGLRLRENSKSWIIGYRPAGTGRAGTYKRMKIATYGSIRSVSEARSIARVQLGQVARQEDPLAHRREQRRREKSRLDEVLNAYERNLISRKYVNRKTSMATLRTNLRPLMARDIRGISGTELIEIIGKIRDDGREGASADFRSRASAFFGWCVSEQRVASNPLGGYRKTRATRAEKVEQGDGMAGRALSDVELTKVWRATNPATSSGLLFRFLILSGCRRSEGAKLSASMVDREEGFITLPPIFTKQARPHIIPLIRALRANIDAAAVDARSSSIFPSPKTGQPLNGWSKLIAQMRQASGVDFTFNDLRKTFRTGLSRLGVNEEYAEMAVGHARAELVAIYNRDDGREIMASIFERWAEHIEKLLAAENARLAATSGKGVFA